MSEQKPNATGVQTAPMPKVTASATRAALTELIKRTNQTPARITAGVAVDFRSHRARKKPHRVGASRRT